MKFVKYNNFWWEYDPKTPKSNATLWNAFGGKTSECDIRNCKIVEAEYFDKLDWKGTELLDDKYNTGWLDREGNFYGCDYRCHNMQAEFVHGKEPRELEKLGWIHIARKRDDKNDFELNASFFGDYSQGVVPTVEQLKYLSAHPGIQIDLSLDAAINYGNYEKARIYEQNLKNEKKSNNKDKKDKDLEM